MLSRWCWSLVLAAASTSCSGARSAGSGDGTEWHDATSDEVAAPRDAAFSDAGAVGDFCMPSNESQPFFSGYEMTEINLEISAPRCLSGLCLVNHFQGRASCPYGQSAAEAEGRGERLESELCHVPGTYEAGGRVAVAVSPQLTRRRPVDAIYCSCRCAGPDPNATYCACGSGLACVDIVPPVAVFDAADTYVGSYCVKAGTAYDPGMTYGSICQVGDAAGLPCGNYDGR